MYEKDYYEILEIEREATQQGIKEAYRRLAFQCHPDRNNGDPRALERMKTINEAYAVLSDPHKRARYDSLRASYGSSAYTRFRDSYSEEDIFRGSDIGQIFEEISRSFGFRGFEDVFKQAYGSNYRTFQFANGNVFGRGFVWFGGTQRRVPNQSGQRGVFPWLMQKLTGYMLGKIAGTTGQPLHRYDSLILTPAQAVDGGKVSYTDKATSRQLLITVPAGISEGQTIRLQGIGAATKNGSVSGDLYLKVRIATPFLHRVKGYLGF